MHDAAHAIVAIDRGRPLSQLEARHGRERHGRARRGGDLAGTPGSCSVAARALLELHADRHLPVADVELGEVGADVADGGDAHGLRDGLGRYAELGGNVA